MLVRDLNKAKAKVKELEARVEELRAENARLARAVEEVVEEAVEESNTQ